MVAENPSVTKPADVDRICEELFLSNRARERDENLLFVASGCCAARWTWRACSIYMAACGEARSR